MAVSLAAHPASAAGALPLSTAGAMLSAPGAAAAALTTERTLEVKPRIETAEEMGIECDKIAHLKHLLSSGGERGDIERAFSSLSDETKNELYFYVWVSDDCPSEPEYGSRTVWTYFHKLVEIHRPLIVHGSGSLLDQRTTQLRILQNAKKSQEIIWKLKAVKEKLSNDPTLSWETLSLEIKSLIPKESFSLVSLQSCIDEHSAIVSICQEEMQNKQKGCFTYQIHCSTFSHKQKNALYFHLSPGVRGQVPSPPYYGYGVMPTLYDTLGSHPYEEGTTFRVHAPHAKNVRVSLSYDGGEVGSLPMVKNHESGYWEVDGKGIKPGQTYRYVIEAQNGSQEWKIDPFALENWAVTKGPFHYESVVKGMHYFRWSDGDRRWVDGRKDSVGKTLPMHIYEVHLQNWRKKGSDKMSLGEMAHQISAYCKEMGYTHIEIMGFFEHPAEGSWGYQPLTLFGATSRLGTLEDMQYFINVLHENNIGVIVDFVGGHFAKDYFGLKDYDGSPLFERPDRTEAWGSLKYNFGNPFVRNYLISAADFLVRHLHVDGFRFDAIDSMLEMEGRDVSKVSQDALTFLRDVNSYLHYIFPGVFTIAESSSMSLLDDAPSAPFPFKLAPSSDSCDFDTSVALGEIHDILRFFQEEPEDRRRTFDRFVGSLSSLTDEHTVLALSHDHKSILPRMSGDDWQKFASNRLLFSLLMCLPGRKSTFMGDEIGQREHWDHRLSMGYPTVKWEELDSLLHRQLQQTVKDLQTLYRTHDQLWGTDAANAFRWIDNKDHENAVFSFHRGNLACIFNFTPRTFEEYTIYFPSAEKDASKISMMIEKFNSDQSRLGGSGVINESAHLIKNEKGETIGFRFRLPPLGCVVFEEHFS